MKTRLTLLAVLLASAAAAQTSAPTRSTNPAARAAQGKDARTAGPDPDLFDGTKFDKENRPETGMLGEFEMPGSNDPQDKSKAGGSPGQAGGKEGAPPKPASAPAGAAGAPSAAGGAESAQTAGSQGASGGGSSVDNSSASGASGAVGGALDESKPMSNSGQSSGAGDPNAKAEGASADSLQGGAAGAAAAQSSGKQSAKSAASKIGSAELRIETVPETDKDVIGREAAPGGTQGSTRPMPNGKGGQGSQNQNKGVEKGKVIPKGL